MKIVKLLIIGLIFIYNQVFSQLSNDAEKNNCYMLKGLYFGQKTPGLVPVIFAPGIISKEGRNESYATYSPNGDAFYFEANDTIYYMEFKDSIWTNPKVADFVGHHGKGNYLKISPNGKIFNFNYQGDIYICKRENNKWNLAEKLPSQINSEKFECGASIANDQSIYYASHRDGTKGACDIFYSQYKKGQYQPPINIDNFNTSSSECGVYISPDNDFIIFTGFNRADGWGSTDMYISFPLKDGSWSNPQNMGSGLNTMDAEWPLAFTPDRKYFLFGRNIKIGDKNNQDIYWVDSKVIFNIIDKRNNSN